jgi:putative Holliday junction resolvase
MRILGLDYGSKTVGVAISDPLNIIARGVETITRKEENKLRKTCARIEELIEEYKVEKIILGLPKHMNDDIGERGKLTLDFKEILKRRTGLEIIMWDERLSTVWADMTLAELNVPRENRKEVVDQVAAAFILQGYLDSIQVENVAKPM